MLNKVPYKNPRGVYRPYLEVLFYNNENKIPLFGFAQMDSGADGNLIPYSVGRKMKLRPPHPNELKIIGGISGGVYAVERDCVLGIANADLTKIYEFELKVDWVHPDLKTQEHLLNLFNVNYDLKSLKSTRGLSPSSQNLLNYTEIEIDKILDSLETEILLGRAFFLNFHYIQFCDRLPASRSQFIYSINKSKIIRERKIGNLPKQS